MTTSNYFQYLDMKTAREREGDVPSAIPRYGDSVRLSHKRNQTDIFDTR